MGRPCGIGVGEVEGGKGGPWGALVVATQVESVEVEGKELVVARSWAALGQEGKRTAGGNGVVGPPGRRTGVRVRS